MSNLLQAGRPSNRTAEHIKEQKAAFDEFKRLNVDLPKSEYLAFKAYALQKEKTVSQLIREAIRERLQNAA